MPTATRPHALAVWWAAARPATLLASVVPVAVGTALAAAQAPPRWPPAVAALLGAIAIQIGTNLFNDYADFKSGADTAERLGPVRVTQRGWLLPRTVLWATGLAFALATLCGLYLLMAAGTVVVVVGLCSVAAGLAYTGGPYPLGYRGLGDLFTFIFFGMVAVCTSYYLQTGHVSLPCAVAAAAIGALATAILVVNNLRDRLTDAPVGKRTLVVRFGATFARVEYALLLGLPYGLLVALWATRPAELGWLLPLASLPLAVRHVRAVWRTDGAALNPLLGRTAQLEALFGVLLIVGVLW